MKLTQFVTCTLCLVGSLSAEFSPFAIRGMGLELPPSMPKYIGMGNAGSALVQKHGASWNNPSKTAFNEFTSFELNFSTGLNYLSEENGHSNTIGSGQVPYIALSHPMGSYANLSLAYTSRFQKKFDLQSPSNSTNQSEKVEYKSGTSEIMVAFAYTPHPRVALGLGYHRFFGAEKQIRSLSVDQVDFEQLSGDTTQTRYLGWYPSFSVTYRTKPVDIAARLDIPLEIEKETIRGITNIIDEEKSTETLQAPAYYGLGLNYKLTPYQHLLADAAFTFWDNKIDSDLNTSFQTALGFESLGKGGRFDSYRSKIHWRAGAGYKLHYFDHLSDTYLSGGLGLPIGQRGNIFDLALVAGHRGWGQETQDTYLQIYFGLTGLSRWGQNSRQ